MESKERIILILLTILNFTHILDFMIMMPLGNYLMSKYGISSQQFSMLVAAYTFSLHALVLTAFLMMGHFMINPFMEFNMGFSKTQTPLVYMVGGALTMVTSPLIGRLADKIGKFNLFVFMAIAGVPLIALITNLPAIPFYFVLCITGVWFIISTGRMIPAQAMVSNVVPPERRGSFMSFNSSVQQLFVGLISVLAGLIVIKLPDNRIENYEITGYPSIAIILFSIFIATMLHRKLREKENATVIREEELAVLG